MHLNYLPFKNTHVSRNNLYYTRFDYYMYFVNTTFLEQNHFLYFN